MRPAEGSMFRGELSRLLIVDTERMERIEVLQDNDPEFYPLGNTPGGASAMDDMLDSTVDFDSYLQASAYMPSGAFSAKAVPNPLPPDVDNCQPISIPSSTPTSSPPDSSSGSPKHRNGKSSSSSPHSAPAEADLKMTEDPEAVGQSTLDGGGHVLAEHSNLFDVPVEGLNYSLTTDTDVEKSNRDMENHFDFDGAASSPYTLRANVNDHAMGPDSGPPGRKRRQARRRRQLGSQFAIARPPSIPGNITALQYRSPRSPGTGFATHGVRETPSSSSSAMEISLETSPSAMFNNHSPHSDPEAEFGAGLAPGGLSPNPMWATPFDITDNGIRNLGPNTQLRSPMQNSLASPFLPAKPLYGRDIGPRLIIHPMPLKSRVETQILLTISLYPMPASVTKLHLPTHTISKPKLLARPPPPRAPDTLELHTLLVCTSAMRNPKLLRRALARAAGIEIKQERASRSPPQEGQSDSSDEDESNPLKGGEVQICTNCMTREKKRSNRKKSKNPDEEKAWAANDSKRSVVLNSPEMREWQQPTKELPIELGTPPPTPESVMQIELPIRIACYCRHQGEKIGFQVIFTIKDHNDNLVAQAISPSIMITDDHKTHAPAQSATPQSMANPSDSIPLSPDPGMFSNDQGLEASLTDPVSMSQFRHSYSTSDLQNLPHTFPQQFPLTSMQPYTAPQTCSTSHTPRNLSRQASISGPAGPRSKKRKANPSGKVPKGLAMTKLDTKRTSRSFGHTKQPNTTPPSATSPYFPNGAPADSSYIQPPPNPPQFHTGPPTPNSNDLGFYTPAQRSQSMEDLPLHPFFATANSAYPSRVPSPRTSQAITTEQAYQHQQTQIVQQVANRLYGLPLSLNPHRPPVIHKLIPNEGPKAGGIEVTCLGSGFCQGLEVLFGDNLATTTTYWGDTSLVCLLPPALCAGTVAVTFKHEQHPMNPYHTMATQKQTVLFNYIDDDEQQLLRLALSVLGQKMTGQREDVRDIARRIVGSSAGDAWGMVGGASLSPGTQQRPTSTLDASVLGFMDLESALLKCLDLIDLDDSPNQARLNLRRGSGQTMLHLACSLGFYRFVAALLVRGANPEPRDKGGYTPMHFAVMHNHSQIVRRLILSGADPDIRTLRGRTPANFTTSEEMLESIRKLKHHSRHRSGGSSRSNMSSSSSLRSLWEATPHGQAAAAAMSTSGRGISATDSEDEHLETNDDDISESELWMRPKRSSRRISMSTDVPQIGSDSSCGVPQSQRGGATTPAMVAWRQQLATHFQHLQQLWNLPNLPNLPQIPPMPALPDYQHYLGNSMGRLNSLVPLRNHSRSGGSSSSVSQAAKEGDYRWWELFSVPSAPPAYEEIYPQRESEITDKKISHVAHAAVDAIADRKCAEAFDKQTTVSCSTGGRSSPIIELRIGGGAITKEAQEELRAAHARKLKKIRSDRNLFFIWIPLLVIMLVAMLKNRAPQAWDSAANGPSYAQTENPGRVVEVL